MKAYLARQLASLGIAAACVGAAPAWAATTVVEPGQLNAAVEAAAPGDRLILRNNTTYTLSEVLQIKAPVQGEPGNSGITIEGPATALASKVVINCASNYIDLARGTSLTLKNLTVSGGGGGASVQAAVTVPQGATLNAGQVMFTDGTPNASIRVAGTINVASCVFTRGIGIRQSSGVANVVQCTFVSSVASIRHTGGELNMLACLFRDTADRPELTTPSSTGNTSANWYDCLIGTDANAPAAAVEKDKVDNPPPAILDSPTTATNYWPGKLDPLGPALFSDYTVGDTDIDSVLSKVLFLRTLDFEYDPRGNRLQIGADEIGPNGRLNGWISSAVVSDRGTFDANGVAIAGGGSTVTVTVEVGSQIDLTDAEIVVIPQLGSLSVADSVDRHPFTRLIGDSIGESVFNAPASACVGGYMRDGMAEIVIITGNGTVYHGADFNLPRAQYTVLLDSTAPVLGNAAGGTALVNNYLDKALSGSDPALVGSVSQFDPRWGPAMVNGRNPVNAAIIGGSGNNPQAFFNWERNELNRSFAVDMQYLDLVPEPCENSAGVPGTPEISGFKVNPPAISVIDDAYTNGDNPGEAFLTGTIPPEFGSATGFTQTSISPSTTASNGMDVTWTFDNFPFDDSGWHALVRPAVTDLAGNLFQHPKPLEFWWLLQEQLTGGAVSLEGPDDPENPVFSWSLNRNMEAPNPRTSVPCVPMVSYRLWAADDPADQYSTYTAITEWSSWTDVSYIDVDSPFRVGFTNTRTFGEILSGRTGDTLLLTIMVGDEAGNLQEGLLNATSFSRQLLTQRITDLFSRGPGMDSIEDEGIVAFRRWGNTEDRGDEVNTRLRAKLFWNRYNPNGPNTNTEGDIRQPETAVPRERDFGSSTRIPLPPVDTCGDGGLYTRVEAQFTVTAESNDPSITTRDIQWEFLQEGRLIASGVVSVVAEAGFRGVVQIPEDLVQGGVNSTDAYGFPFSLGVLQPDRWQPIMQSSPCSGIGTLGDRMGDEGTEAAGKRRRSIKYLFRAATLTLLDPNDASKGTVPDETPATFQFTVTPGDEFDTGEQPIKVFAPL